MERDAFKTESIVSRTESYAKTKETDKSSAAADADADVASPNKSKKSPIKANEAEGRLQKVARIPEATAVEA